MGFRKSKVEGVRFSSSMASGDIIPSPSESKIENISLIRVEIKFL